MLGQGIGVNVEKPIRCESSLLLVMPENTTRPTMMIEGYRVDVQTAKSLITCNNINENTTLSEARGPVQITSGVRVSDENRLEQTYALKPRSFIKGHTPESVGPRVANSHTDTFEALEKEDVEAKSEKPKSTQETTLPVFKYPKYIAKLARTEAAAKQERRTAASATEQEERNSTYYTHC
ncbi:hypothetical protein Tco_0660734 [Tanacetum coccineum]